MTEDEWKHVFDIWGNDARRWRSYAHNLLESSAALLRIWDDWQRGFSERAAGKAQHSEQQPGYHGTATMLRGMACECLLKALGLERETLKRLAHNGRFVPIVELKKRKKTQHDLVALAEIVGFALESEHEKRALRAMERAIVAGRYPIVSNWEAERRHYVEGPPPAVRHGMEWDSEGDNILRRLLGGPLP